MGEGGCDGRLHVTEGGRRECDKATGVVGLTPPWGVTRRIVCPFFLCRALLVFCCLPLFETFSLPTCTCVAEKKNVTNTVALGYTCTSHIHVQNVHIYCIWDVSQLILCTLSYHRFSVSSS